MHHTDTDTERDGLQRQQQSQPAGAVAHHAAGRHVLHDTRDQIGAPASPPGR
ncbi:hypothetical protein [Aeromicrobium sp. UC242_57]|uniref:hypothetical protein n=1 Tax=Aeromicrobium sp. UC242_57 TaxID=3374624 RepID=UPI0037AC7086